MWITVLSDERYHHLIEVLELPCLSLRHPDVLTHKKESKTIHSHHHHHHHHHHHCTLFWQGVPVPVCSKNRHWLQLTPDIPLLLSTRPKFRLTLPHFGHLPQICQNWPQIWPRSPGLRPAALGCLHTWYKSRLVVKHDMCEHVLLLILSLCTSYDWASARACVRFEMHCWALGKWSSMCEQVFFPVLLLCTFWIAPFWDSVHHVLYKMVWTGRAQIFQGSHLFWRKKYSTAQILQI